MKIGKLFMAGGLIGTMLAGSAFVQAATPSQVYRTAMNDSYVYWEPEAGSSQAAAPAPQSSDGCGMSQCASCESGCESGCDNGCGCGEQKCRWCHCGSLEDAWTLPQPDCLACRGINVSGFLEGGMYSNAYGASSNGPLGLESAADGFNANQMWIYGEKKVDTGGCGIDWGGRIDYVFGTDGPDTQAFGDQGWDYGWNSSSIYGSAIPQAYLEVGINDWTVRAGHFYTLIGYEVVPATGNFFYSHSYTFYYGEPFTHTGMTLSRKINDKWTAVGGWVDGWDGSFENNNGASMFLGGLTWALSDKTSLLWYCTGGNFGNGQFSGNAGELYMNSIVLTHQLTERWSYVFQHDLGVNYDIPGEANREWYGINQYLIYKINDCWSFGGRFEWFRDDEGARINGNPGNYYEMTAGVNWRPHTNVILRPEVRYDWFQGDVVGGNYPFDNGTKDNQFSGGFDAIFTF